MVEKLQTPPLRERVYERLKQRILRLEWCPGDQIVIDQVADELSVSHTPVREALAMLELDGLVSMQQYKTPRVASIDEQDVREVYEMRILLEGWAAYQAAGLLRDSDLAEIEKTILRGSQEIVEGHFETHLHADVGLHDLILRAAPNSLFQRLAQQVTDRSVRIRALVEADRGAEVALAIDREHLEIVGALMSHKPELARDLVVTHLKAAMGRTLNVLSNTASGK